MLGLPRRLIVVALAIAAMLVAIAPDGAAHAAPANRQTTIAAYIASPASQATTADENDDHPPECSAMIGSKYGWRYTFGVGQCIKLTETIWITFLGATVTEAGHTVEVLVSVGSDRRVYEALLVTPYNANYSEATLYATHVCQNIHLWYYGTSMQLGAKIV